LRSIKRPFTYIPFGNYFWLFLSVIGRSPLYIAFLKQMNNFIPNAVSEIGTGPRLPSLPIRMIWFDSKFISKMAAFHMSGWSESGPPQAPLPSRSESLLKTSHSTIDPRLHG
jgi:hypothetical protein